MVFKAYGPLTKHILFIILLKAFNIHAIIIIIIMLLLSDVAQCLKNNESLTKLSR